MPDRLLSLLTETPQPGPALAGRLGVGRVRVNALARELQEQGYPVTIERRGYALAPGTPAPQLLALRGSFGRAARYLGTTGSTQDALRAWALDAADPAPAGALVLAEWQTAGRGRRGRRWEGSAQQAQPPGGLTFSVLLPAGEGGDLAQLGLWPLAAGVALQRAALAVGARGTGLKWPNDLQDGRGRKLAGVLLEADLRGETLQRAVLGIGINVSAAPLGAGWLDACLPPGSPPIRRSTLLTELLWQLEHWLAQPAAAVLDAWRAASHTLGRRVEVLTPAGLLRGLALDLDRGGALLVRPDGPAGGTGPPVARVSAGDVQLVGTFGEAPVPAFLPPPQESP